MIEKRYTVEEVSEALHESPTVIKAACRRGLFDGAYKKASGGKTSPWIIPESAVEAYLQRYK
jgi:hypothetical protein